MKYNVNDLTYFKCNYVLEIKSCWVCQIIKYLSQKNEYLVVCQDIYVPGHYHKSIVKEDDLGDLNQTFVLQEKTLKDLKTNITLSEVLKLPYLDLYSDKLSDKDQILELLKTIGEES